MTSRRKVFSVLLALAIVVAMMCAAVLPASAQPPTINSHWESSAPTIDGTFGPGEWINHQLLINNPIHTYVYFTNDNEFLYICIDAANAVGGDYTLDPGDHCSLAFDTGHDELWTEGHEDHFDVFGAGLPEHAVASAFLGFWNKHCDFDAHPGLEGAAGFDVSPNAALAHRIYEIKIPLTLLMVSPGETIGFASPSAIENGSFPYDDDTRRHNYWPPGAVNDDLSTWGDLVLATQPVPGIPSATQWGAIGMVIIFAASLAWATRRRLAEQG
ncbi:MAG: hypothetical protein SVM79_06900 [Chloroflexota bacterium]|nr:hypothetical protein [Chloroflexota bacterium]